MFNILNVIKKKTKANDEVAARSRSIKNFTSITLVHCTCVTNHCEIFARATKIKKTKFLQHHDGANYFNILLQLMIL